MTFWTLGALHRMRHLLAHVTEWAGVSAGAAMAAACCTGRIMETLEDFTARTTKNDANVYPLDALRGRPVFPQEAMYRAAVLSILGDDGFEALKASAPLRILLVHFARGAPVLRTVWGAARAYRARRKRKILHGPDRPYPGLVEERATAQDCSSKEDLCDLIMASSCTPPITSVQRIGGRAYADGALVDHVPVRVLSDEGRSGRILAFSTMCIPVSARPRIDGRLYLTPSRPIPIAMWDYAHPDRVREAFDLGVRDAEGFVRPAEDLLSAG
jgi:predicted acylesterase/phospholipase RssA